MPKGGVNKADGRDYSYDKAYQKRPDQRKNQLSRKKARYSLEKEGLVKRNDGKDVDHKNGNPRQNGRSNLQIMSASKNRSKK